MTQNDDGYVFHRSPVCLLRILILWYCIHVLSFADHIQLIYNINILKGNTLTGLKLKTEKGMDCGKTPIPLPPNSQFPSLKETNGERRQSSRLSPLAASWLTCRGDRAGPAETGRPQRRKPRTHSC